MCFFLFFFLTSSSDLARRSWWWCPTQNLHQSIPNHNTTHSYTQQLLGFDCISLALFLSACVMMLVLVVAFLLTLSQPYFVNSLLQSRVPCKQCNIKATAVFCHKPYFEGDRNRVTTATTTDHPTTFTSATRLHTFATVTAAIAAISAITLLPATPVQADDDDNSIFIDKENKFALVIPPSWQTGYARKQSSSGNLMAKYLPEEVRLSHCLTSTNQSISFSNQPIHTLTSSDNNCHLTLDLSLFVSLASFSCINLTILLHLSCILRLPLQFLTLGDLFGP